MMFVVIMTAHLLATLFWLGAGLCLALGASEWAKTCMAVGGAGLAVAILLLAFQFWLDVLSHWRKGRL